MLLLVRHLQRINSSVLLLVVILMLLLFFASEGNISIPIKDTERINKDNFINMWYNIYLKGHFVKSDTSNSKNQNHKLNFHDQDQTVTITDAVSLLTPESLRRNISKSLQNSHIESHTMINQLSFEVDFMSLKHLFKRTFATSNVMKVDSNTLLSNIKNFTRRYRREDENACYKFEEGDHVKKEFYSPYYPEPYPKNISCFKVLEADPGMVLKVEFRDNFELEDQEKCTYDFLEVRDGKYGYSRLIGKFCRAFPFPEITSSSRYLWLHFRSDNSIQGRGFRAVWTMIPRPSVKTPESEECVLNVTNLLEYEIKTSEIAAQKKTASELGTELDCIWNIIVPDGWKIQMTFPKFHLDKPNECDINYVQVYDKEPTMTNNPSLINNFCGSIADLVTSKGSEAYLRFFVTKTAMNSSFEAIMTAVREKESKDKGCNDNEFDCQDACISDKLRCNNRANCRYRFDEDADVCNTKNTGLNVNSEHVIIILVVFTFLMTGLCFTFTFNCMKKLIRDHKIIKEHIRQSRENRLDELGRKTTPCPMTNPCIEINNVHLYNSESPSLEVLSNPKELIPSMTIINQDYGNKCNVSLSIDLNDIHQSNNVRNATQELLQESNEEHETRDIECQTRESLFDSTFILKPFTHPEFTKMDFETSSCSSKPSLNYRPSQHYHHHAYPCQHTKLYTYNYMYEQMIENNSNSLADKLEQDVNNQRCSICHPSDGLSTKLCLRHIATPIVPAPPEWSTNESAYNSVICSTKLSKEKLQESPNSIDKKLSPKFIIHQKIIDSSKNYEFICDINERKFNECRMSNRTKLKRSNIPKPIKFPQATGSQFKTEAIIEIDQKHPFSIESSKSAPDVMAMH